MISISIITFFLINPFLFLLNILIYLEINHQFKISRYENIDGAIALRKFTKWLWIDYFDTFPLTKYQIEDLSKFNLSSVFCFARISC